MNILTIDILIIAWNEIYENICIFKFASNFITLKKLSKTRIVKT